MDWSRGGLTLGAVARTGVFGCKGQGWGNGQVKKILLF